MRVKPVLFLMITTVWLLSLAVPSQGAAQNADLLLFNPVSVTTVGEDQINAAPPTSQIVKLIEHVRTDAAVGIGVQNQSGGSDDFVLDGCAGNRKVRVKYLWGVNNVTPDVIAGIDIVSLDGGVTTWFDVHMKPKKGVEKASFKCNFGLTSAGDSSTDFTRVIYRFIAR